MGYTTDFTGEIKIEPPLNEKEIEYLNKFADSRRMSRLKGPYFIGGSGYGGGEDSDVLDHNNPDSTQPGLWCQWVPNSDGTAIEWDGGEKFYESDKWMEYLINHFVGDNPIAKQLEPKEFKFLQGHILNGIILAEGEDRDDVWYLAVSNNQVKVCNKKSEANKFLKETSVPVIVSEEVSTDTIKSKYKKLL